MNTRFLFEVWPYAAAAIFFVGLIIRYALESRRPDAAPNFSDVRGLFAGTRFWRIGLTALLLGHLAGLILPQQILLWNRAPARLYALEAAAFGAGVSALAGGAVILWRYLGRHGGSVAGQLADAIWLSLLFVALLSGLLMASVYRWGSSWGVLTLTPYARLILQGAPASALVGGLPFLVQLHIFSSLTALAAVPFTRLAPLLLATIRRALALASKPAYQIGGWCQRKLEAGLDKYKPALWIWPEED